MSEMIGIKYVIDLKAFKASATALRAEMGKLHKTIGATVAKMPKTGGLDIRAVQNATNELRKMGITSATTAKQIQKMGFSGLDWKKISRLTSVQMGKLEKATRGTGRASQIAAQRYARFSKRLTVANHQVSQHANRLGDAQRAMERWSLSGMKAMAMSQAAWLASGAVIFGLLSTIRKVLAGFLDFNQGMIDAAAITQATTSGYEVMREAATKAFTASTMSIKDTTEALTLLGQAGLDAREAAIALETVYKVTTATGAGAIDAVKFLTTAMFVWRIEATDAARVGNVLGAALNYSKLEVEDLSTVFNYAATMAKTVGLSMEDLAATIAVMANAGVKASTIGTGLTGVFSKLIASTPKFRKQLASVGLSMKDVSLVTNDFFTVLKRLQDAKFDITKIFKGLRRREARALNVILDQGVDAFLRMQEALTDTTAVEVMFNRSIQGTKNQLIVLGHQIQSSLIDLLTKVDPIIRGIVKYMRELLSITKSLGPVIIATVGAVMILKVAFWAAAVKGSFLVTIMKKLHWIFGLFVRHPIIMGFTALIAAVAGAKAIYDKLSNSAEEVHMKLITEIDDLRKLRILLLDTNKSHEQKLQILADYALDYPELLKFLDQEIIYYDQLDKKLRPLIELRKEENRVVEEGILLRMKTELARKEMLYEKGALPFTEFGFFPSRAKAKKQIDDLKREIKKLEIDLAIDKPKFEDVFIPEWTTEMAKAARELEYKLANEREQARIDLEKKLIPFSFKEEAYTSKRQEILKKDYEFEADRKADIDKLDEFYEKQKQGRALATSEYKRKLLDIEEKETKLKEKNQEKFLSIREAITAKIHELTNTELQHEIWASEQAKNKKIENLENLKLTEEEFRTAREDAEREHELKVAEFKKVAADKSEKEADDTAKKEKQAQELKTKYAQTAASNMAEAFKNMGEVGAIEQEKAFRLYKAFSIVEVMISTAKSIMRAIADLGPIAGPVVAGTFAALGATQIALIAAQQPPKAHEGGLIRAHDGGMQRVGGYEPNETLRILKDKEFVIKDSSTRSLGAGNLDYMNRTGQIPMQRPSITNVSNYYIDAIDPISFDKVLRERGAMAIRDVSLGSYAHARRRRDPRTR